MPTLEVAQRNGTYWMKCPEIDTVYKSPRFDMKGFYEAVIDMSRRIIQKHRSREIIDERGYWFAISIVNNQERISELFEIKVIP